MTLRVRFDIANWQVKLLADFDKNPCRPPQALAVNM